MSANGTRALPQRITLARELRGLTKTELAHRINKTPGAISHFEQGRTQPDAATLGALSLCLGVPVEFFRQPLQTQRLALEECHFRSLRSASQRERRQLLAFGTLLCELARKLERDVELPEFDLEPQPVADGEGIEERALEVRRSWGLGDGPILEPIRLLEQRGVIVSLVPEACMRVDAFSGWQAGRPFVFLLGGSQPSRSRFDASHELGHLVMHTDVVPGDRQTEREADRFAGAFLLPKEGFLRDWHGRRPRLRDFYEMKAHWRVSAAALIRRAYDLGCISQSSYHRLFRHRAASRDQWIGANELELEGPSMLAQAIESSKLLLLEVGESLGLRVPDVASLLVGQLGARIDQAE